MPLVHYSCTASFMCYQPTSLACCLTAEYTVDQLQFAACWRRDTSTDSNTDHLQLTNIWGPVTPKQDI